MIGKKEMEQSCRALVEIDITTMNQWEVLINKAKETKYLAPVLY